jgi:hypothetical protein
MPFLLPAFPADLGPSQASSVPPVYNVRLHREKTDLKTFGAVQDLYPFVPDDLVYYRSCDVDHSLDLEWRNPQQGSPPWSIVDKCSTALKDRWAKLRIWSRDDKCNHFKTDITSSGWPGATLLSNMTSIFPPPDDVPMGEVSVWDQMHASAGGRELVAEKLAGMTIWVEVFIPLSQPSAEHYHGGSLSSYNSSLGGNVRFSTAHHDCVALTDSS